MRLIKKIKQGSPSDESHQWNFADSFSKKSLNKDSYYLQCQKEVIKETKIVQKSYLINLHGKWNLKTVWLNDNKIKINDNWPPLCVFFEQLKCVWVHFKFMKCNHVFINLHDTHAPLQWKNWISCYDWSH